MKEILIIALIIISVILLAQKENWISKAIQKNEQRFRNNNENIINASSTRERKDEKERLRNKWLKDNNKVNRPAAPNPKWYPTGWVFNEETQKWDPPDYLIEESNEKWAWDDHNKVWIDQEKAARLKRYHEFRKSQNKEPTYEEWKAAQKDKSTN